MSSMHIEGPYLQAALKRYPTLAVYPYIAEAMTLLGIDNHTSTSYYAAGEFYITKHAAKFDPVKLNDACRLAHANDDLEQLVYGEHEATLKLLAFNQAYKDLDWFLNTVFGETTDSDPAAPWNA